MVTNTGTLPRLLTREQAAEILGVLPQTLAVWFSTRRYDLPVVHVGRSVRYRESDILAFIESRVSK
jgi:predicted DNA-binding transcriptional regulator AlpA